MQAFPFPGDEKGPRRLFISATQGETRGIVLVLHGMAEHAARYHQLSAFLAERGYVTVVYNQRGHGPETPGEQLGYFADKGGWQLLVEDAERVRVHLTETFPGMPFALFGHSMGSFVARTYALRYPQALGALVLSGTGWHPRALCFFGGSLAKLACAMGKGKQPAHLLHRMAFTANNRRMRPARTALDWLSRDTAQVDAYMADPLCGFPLANAGYRDMFAGLLELTKRDRFLVLPKALPVMIISGKEDAVGAWGKGPEVIARQYRDAGLEDVRLNLYEGARHELLNEVNRAQVMADLTDWLDQAMA